MEKQSYQLTAWYAALHAKCPRCRRGAMFSGTLYTFKTNQMNSNCPHCDLHYEIEPGYFYAAMFVSYALNVAEMVTAAVAISILSGSHNPWIYSIIIVSIAFLFYPINFRYSRVILMYWLTPGLKFRPELSQD